MLHDHPTLMAKMREDVPVRSPMPGNSKRVADRMSSLCKGAVVWPAGVPDGVFAIELKLLSPFDSSASHQSNRHVTAVT
jgi:hypothetical protein